MSDDEINEEICKFLGWKFSDHPDHIAKTAMWQTAKSFAIKPDGEFVFRCSIPRFTTSLDLMHEVESTETVSATARQRAEAFLRTIGKWKEEA